MSLQYFHVDVFSNTGYNGNSLPVFLDSRGLNAGQMLRISQELRHFEAIFLEATSEPDRWRARIFDLSGELPFAGHPIIGAAALLHHVSGAGDEQTWSFELTKKAVRVTTGRIPSGYFGLMDQGRPEFDEPIADPRGIAEAFSIERSDFDSNLPVQVVSTGLRYLIVPLAPGVIGRARIASDITPMLERFNAQFAVLLDDSELEIRHWTNDGVVEDSATGSAAGTIGAYRLRHALIEANEQFALNQGRFTGRPSVLRVQPIGSRAHIQSVKVGGDVSIVGRGVLDVLP